MNMKESDVVKHIGFTLDVIDRKFEKGFVTLQVENYEGTMKDSVKVPLVSVTRTDAMKMVGINNNRVRDYELEMELHKHFSVGHFINEVCPLNGFSTCKPEYFQETPLIT
jgi:hypothetical protein